MQWSGTILCHHGAEKSWWWKVECKKHKAPKKWNWCNVCSGECYDSQDVLVYKGTYCVFSPSTRDQYLGLMGSQSKVYCQEHQLHSWLLHQESVSINVVARIHTRKVHSKFRSNTTDCCSWQIWWIHHTASDIPANTLGAYTPIIMTNHPLIPFKTHSSIPPTPVQGFGDQIYLIQGGVKINLFAAQMHNKTVCCSVIGCNRQNILEKMKSCGTLWKEKHWTKALVLDIDTSFSLEDTTKEVTIQYFQSFWFSQIFLSYMDKFDDISEEALWKY